MAVEIYNEGRVTGYSAYETYVKQFLLVNPEGTPATEREWLASSLAMGSSLVITVPQTISSYTAPKITAQSYISIERTDTITDITVISSFTQAYLSNIVFKAQNEADSFNANEIIANPQTAITYLNQYSTIEIYNYNMVDFTPNENNQIKIFYGDATSENYHIIDIDLPIGTNLRAGNTIIGSYTNLVITDGEKVSSYSEQLIPNNATVNPVGESEDVVVIDDAKNLPKDINGYNGLTPTELANIADYLKIQDGVILQPGSWGRADSENMPPECEFLPDLSKPPILRLLIKGYITAPFNIFLTGFTDAGVLNGVTGLGISTKTQNPEDGDFLGPAVFPWANKVIFTLNTKSLYGMSQNTLPIRVDDTDIDANYIKLGVANIPTINNTSYSSDIVNAGLVSTNAGSGYLMWAQLFQALPEDKKIQIVSDILLSLSNDLSLTSTDYTLASGKSLKVGKNYIDFNGVRLYISNTTPTDTDIPNGSIGIGW